MDGEQQVVNIEIHDVEEGEISDSASIEEISEEAFKTTPPLRSAVVSSNSNVKDSNNSSSSGSGSGSRVWTMKDVYKYHIASSNSYSGLYNLAWAQAVNNKPLDEVFVMMNDTSKDDTNKAGNDDKVVIVEDDDEKEEGELEEGEIDMESDLGPELNMEEKHVGNEVGGEDANMMERKKRVDLIKEELERLMNVADDDKSYDSLCSRLEKTTDNLLEIVVQEDGFPEKESLVQLLFIAIRNTHSFFSSITQRLNNEQNRNVLMRLLAQVTSLQPPLFSSPQLKEMEIILSSLNSLTNSSSDGSSNNMPKQIGKGITMTGLENFFEHANDDPTNPMTGEIEYRSYISLNQPEDRFPVQNTKSGLINSRPKGVAVPLLDLHKDHDADSLPSPTREISAAPLPFGRGFSSERMLVKPEWPVPAQTACRGESIPKHRYETDAVRAVSSYQQKFGPSKFLMNERLPSPTPSEEGETADSEISGEVSSSISQNSAAVSSSTVPRQPMVSSASYKDILNTQENRTTHKYGPASKLQNSAPKSSAKSRDPRLRLANSDAGKTNIGSNHSSGVNEGNSEPHCVVSMQKQKIVDDELLLEDYPAVKRQRNGSKSSEPAHTASGTGGWLEDKGTVGMLFPSANNTHEASGSRNMEHAVTRVTTSSSNRPVVMAHAHDKFQSMGQVTTSPAASTTMRQPCSSATAITTPVTDMILPATSLNAFPMTSQSMKQPVENFNATSSSLNSLLRDIAVNPSIWMNILAMEQAKFSESIRSTSELSNSFSMVATLSSTSGAPPLSSMSLQIKTGTVETPSQERRILQEDSGKVRMKSRDPRRMLHNGALQKGMSAGSDQSKVTSASSSSATVGNLCSGRQEDQLDKKLWSSNRTKLPDITTQFTESLRNVADIVSVSQASKSLPVIRQTSLPQPSQVVMDAKSSAIVELDDATESTEAVTAPPRTMKANAWSDFDHLFGAYDSEQKAAIQIERAKRFEEQKKMFAQRKLSLVLDLDHTLLNSAKFGEVDPPHDEMLRKKEEQDREKPKRCLFRFPHMGMWTKLRPGIWNFLEKASKLYELHLYTMGNKFYATEMAKLLDPNGELFGGRVISRGDDGEPPFDGDHDRVLPKSKDLEGVLGMEPAVVIIDDSVRVWPHNRLNLIVVERYIYFPCSRRQFGLPGPSLLEIDHDERPEDGTLASSLAVIERIHAKFFAHESLDDADVRDILASEQRKILSGCRIVFSRVFPVGEANPQMHPLWKTAEQFGAVCTNQIDDQVTHVVANSLGTDKVNWALSRGKFVVHPGWVEASALLYRRANEHDFAIK